MFAVKTTDGREYRYDTFESAFLAARTLFGWEGYTITDLENGREITGRVRDKERKL